MVKSLRIRTEIGVDKEVTFDLNQEFDLLEILSLRLHQTDVYPKDCSRFGVVCGRVLVNGGYGLPNAKVSIFIPLDSEDEEHPIISSIYPYKTPNFRNEEGYRYNLLSSVPNYKGHQSTGSFPTLDSALLNQEVSYVYNKYYKYTAKTNDSGDFMIYGVPLGEQKLQMNVDLSDIGCFSMVPEDFKIQGESEGSFDGAAFKTDSNLDSLPQIVMLSKSIDIKPLWGDKDSGCGATITRADFDLRESGSVEIKPTAVFMGSMVTDTDRHSVNRKCKPKRKMGQLCDLSPSQAKIESIRFTPYFKPDARPTGYTNNPGQTELVPVLERFDIQGGYTMDDNGAFLINVPMNLDYVTTNEFGEQVISKKPGVGVPTKGKYRFRIKPLETVGTARQRRRGAFLVPQIKEHTLEDVDFERDWPWNILGLGPQQQTSFPDRNSYSFSVNYYDYSEASIDIGDILTCNDVFYEFHYSKVYTLASFHNHWKHRGRDAFIGIKEIQPREEDACTGQAMPFPMNSANKNVNFQIIMNQFVTRFLQGVYTFLYYLMIFVCTIVDFILWIVGLIKKFFLWLSCLACKLYYVFSRRKKRKYCTCSDCICNEKYETMDCNSLFGCLFLRITKYPECDKCGCFSNNLNGSASDECQGGLLRGADDEPTLWGQIDDNDYMECNSPTKAAKGLDQGCYSIDWDNILSFIKNLFDKSEPGKTTYIADWRKRENLFRSMCDGLMNYFWSNNWVGGLLYAFLFRAKIRGSADGVHYRSQHCDEIVFFHAKDQEYYYRCTPFRYDFATGMGRFVGSPAFDARRPLLISFLLGGPIGVLINVLSDDKASGANERNLHWPTTILDLGPVKTNIGEICGDTGGAAEGCSISPYIGASTFDGAGDFMFDAINEIVNYNDGSFDSITLRTPFRRFPEQFWWSGLLYPGRRRELGGGMASIISQFNEIGVDEYSTPTTYEVEHFASQCSPPNCNPATTYTAENLGWDYAPAGGNTNIGGSPPSMWDTDWPNDTSIPTIMPSNASWPSGWDPQGLNYWIARSTSVPGPGLDDSVEVTPTFLSGDSVNPSAEHLRECLIEVNNNTSQVVPFFPWGKNGPAYGDQQWYYADWRTEQNNIVVGDMQNIYSWLENSGVSMATTTPISPNQTQSRLSLGTGFHYYFGLIPGATSYDTFLKKYVPATKEEPGDDYVIV